MKEKKACSQKYEKQFLLYGRKKKTDDLESFKIF